MGKTITLRDCKYASWREIPKHRENMKVIPLTLYKELVNWALNIESEDCSRSLTGTDEEPSKLTTEGKCGKINEWTIGKGNCAQIANVNDVQNLSFQTSNFVTYLTQIIMSLVNAKVLVAPPSEKSVYRIYMIEEKTRNI